MRMGRLTTITGLSFLCLATPALAQQYFDPGLFQTAIQSKPADFEAPGARLGSFVFLPGADLAWVHNDNVFYTPDAPQSDSVYHVRPYASLASDWNRHSVAVQAFGDIARYQSFSENDYEDWALRADGRLDVRERSWFSADISYYHLHEDRRSPDAGAPATPTEFDYGGWGLGYDHVFNRLKVGAYYNWNAFDYDNNVTADGEFIDNSTRDREQNRITLRGDYQIGPETAVFASYGYNTIDYDEPLDETGLSRNSDGQNLQLGMTWDMSDLLTGDVSVGYSRQSYDAAGFEDVSGWSLGAGLTWQPTALTTISLRAAGSPQETSQSGTSGYFSRLYSIRLQQELHPRLLFNARAAVTDNDYANPGLSDTELASTQVRRFDIGMSYLFNRNLSLSGGYGYEKQSANQARFRYDVNRYFLVLGLEY